MAMTPDEKAVMKTYLSRKLRTLPFLIIMFFSLLPLCHVSFQWVRGQLAWHKTEAQVIEVNEDGGGKFQYIVTRTGESLKGTYYPYRILFHYQIGKPLHENDIVRISYNPKKPDDYVVFHRLELQMLTWGIVFVFCFVIYFWLEWAIKKRETIKIAG